MSDNVEQKGPVKITSLELLDRAVRQIHVKGLDCSLRVDASRRRAYEWNGTEKECDAAIVFDRDLSAHEQRSFYEIALVAKSEKDGSGQDQTFYSIFANTSDNDRGMQERLNQIYQNYRVEEVVALGQARGLVDVYETPGRAGWRRVEITLPA